MKGYDGHHELVLEGYSRIAQLIHDSGADGKPLRDVRLGTRVTRVELVEGGGCRVMVDGGEVPYECHAALQGGAFSGFKTHRANVGAFMADLVTDKEVWAKWKNSYPHCYDTPAGDKKGDY